MINFFWGKKQMGFKAPKNEADIYTCSKIVKGTVEDAKAAETTFTPTADGAFVVDNILAK